MIAIDGSASRRASTRENRGAISVSTTALSTSVPRWAAPVSCAWDHFPQVGSSVNTSSSTLLSTTVPAPASPSREGEDLVGSEFDVAGAAHLLDLAGDAIAVYDEPGALFVELKPDLAAGTDP